MKDIWDKPITADTDWGGDASTGGLPVSGRIVQEYIKSRLKTDDQLKAFIKAYLDENGMSEDQGYVTLATEQTIKAIKDFEAGLKIGGSLITYDKDLNAFILRANLVTEGGITARALLDEVDVPTFMDGVVTDEVTISKADGVLRVLKAGLDKEELINILEEEKYVTQSWVKSYNAEELKKYVLKTDLPSDIVTLSIDQEITGIKNFANGFEIAGIKFSKSQDGTIFLDGNLVTSGGITARGTNETVTPSIFEALPIDGNTIKRTADGRLYVDADALNISGGGGVADSVSWENVTGKPSWIGSTKPTYTPREVGALGALDNAVSASTLLMEDLADLNNATTGRFFTMTGGYGSMNGNKPEDGFVTGLTLTLANNSEYRRQMAFGSSDNIFYRTEIGGIWGKWRFILDSQNFSYFALPLTGGKVNGLVQATSFIGNLTGNADSATSAKYLYQSNIQESINYPRGTDHAIKVVNCTSPKQDGFFSDYTTVLSVASPLSNFQLGMYANPFSTRAPRPRFRAMRNTDGVWTDWKELAFVEDLSAYLPLTGGTVNGNLLVIGGITARYTSDERLKKNLRPINAGQMILSLGRVREFEYIDSEVEKNNLYKGSHIGLIYQDVKGSALSKICFVREDGYGSLNYWDTSLKALLVGVAQEHEVRLTEDERDIQAVKEENKALRKEIEQLKQRVA